MSHLVSRILLSIFMFPLAGIFYLVVFIIGTENTRFGRSSSTETELFLGCGILTWLMVAIYWCLLWKSSVKWNSSRRINTGLATGGAAIAGIIAAIFCEAMLQGEGMIFGCFVGGILAIVLWLIGTVLIWRETAAERAKRIRESGKAAITCPTCGYNLTGLSESRCPECGSKFTLDELVAMQPARADAME